ncbi:MAG: IS66 family transposase [Phycisphaerae bacterium]
MREEVKVLGEDFPGTLGCDYFSAYHKYRRECGITMQFCLAHLIRDVKFLTTLPETATVAYGQRLLEVLRTLFHTLHQRELMEPSAFQKAFRPVNGYQKLDAGDEGLPK